MKTKNVFSGYQKQLHKKGVTIHTSNLGVFGAQNTLKISTVM